MQKPSIIGLAPKGIGYELRNDCRKILSYFGHEFLLSGPAETGKTIACCLKCHLICSTVAGAQGSVVRKTNSSLNGSVVRTLLRVLEPQIKGDKPTIRIYGGETPSRLIYNNGSCIWLGGLDSADSFLSAERDFIYINQAEEVTEADWEVLSTRCSGRAAVVRDPQIFGDCNPSSRLHWIRERAQSGKLKLLVSTHRDNPTLYENSAPNKFDGAGPITEQGMKSLAVLDALSGVLRLRLKEGIWASAEGAVYDNFNADIKEKGGHVCERPREEMVGWYLGLDPGFTHPAALVLVGYDSDRRWHIFREFYETNILPERLVEKVVAWNKEFSCEFCACDSAEAGLIASLRVAGVNALGPKKSASSIKDGIALIKNRLEKVKADTSDKWIDGRPRLTVSSFCVNTIKEFESYQWKADCPKDVPVDDFNHALDAARYIALQIQEGSGTFTSLSKIDVPAAGPAGKTFVPRQFVSLFRR